MTNKYSDDKNCCDNGCNCDNDQEEMDIIYLTLEDDSELECGVLGIFEIEDKSYIALVSLDDEEQVLLYEYKEDGDEFELGQIEDEDELEAVLEAFDTLFMEDDYDEDEFDDIDEFEDYEDCDEDEEDEFDDDDEDEDEEY